MPRRPPYQPLNVFLNSKLAGQLRRVASGAIDFRYTESWLNWEHTFPVSFSLPLREDTYSGDSVVAVFENLLPDSDVIRQRLAARTEADGTDAFSLLSTIGRDCVGAMQFLPEGDEPSDTATIQSRPISDEQIAHRLRNLRTTPLGIDPRSEFRISLAGAQDKTGLLKLNGEWHQPEGSTPTTHIFKPQIGQSGDFDLSRSVENEHFCMNLLGELGFEVAPTEIVDFYGTRVLVIERFDRHWASDGRLLRRPQEDICQALGVNSSKKYQSDGGPRIEHILQFLKASDNPEADQYVFVKAQIAFWLLGAIDGHAKNFSIFLKSGGGFRMTPLYDVMTVQHLLERGTVTRRQAKMAMSVGDNRHYRLHDIQPRHFAQTVASAGLSQTVVTRAFSDLVNAMPDAVEHCCEDSDRELPTELLDGVRAGVKRRISAAAKWLEAQ
ncbi:MAG: type II toxin-antitoxin system HipA family toxin [Gammaproteobacteria bacterium]